MTGTSLPWRGTLKGGRTDLVQMIFTLKRRTHKPMYFCKMYQKKVNVMGLACVLTVAEPHWDPDLQAGLGQLLTAILKQSLALKQQEVQCAIPSDFLHIAVCVTVGYKSSSFLGSGFNSLPSVSGGVPVPFFFFPPFLLFFLFWSGRGVAHVGGVGILVITLL